MSCCSGWDVIPRVGLCQEGSGHIGNMEGLQRAVTGGGTAKARHSHTVGGTSPVGQAESWTGVLPTDPWPVCPCPFGLEE